MTIRELDRLVTKTEMTPVSKAALKEVRRAVVAGRCGDTRVGRGSWSVSVSSGEGYGVRMNFSFKRDENAS